MGSTSVGNQRGTATTPDASAVLPAATNVRVLQDVPNLCAEPGTDPLEGFHGQIVLTPFQLARAAHRISSRADRLAGRRRSSGADEPSEQINGISLQRQRRAKSSIVG
jgi:hypothetical protein